LLNCVPNGAFPIHLFRHCTVSQTDGQTYDSMMPFTAVSTWLQMDRQMIS